MATSNLCRSDLAPPMCCQPPMSPEVWEERGRRIEAARPRAEESHPKFCPNVGCGSDDIFPTFVGDAYECGDCSLVWEAKP